MQNGGFPTQFPQDNEFHTEEGKSRPLTSSGANRPNRGRVGEQWQQIKEEATREEEVVEVTEGGEVVNE